MPSLSNKTKRAFALNLTTSAKHSIEMRNVMTNISAISASSRGANVMAKVAKVAKVGKVANVMAKVAKSGAGVCSLK